jgi:hypothetical protein
VKLFPTVTITQTELNVAAENISHPAVHKYIQAQIYSAAAGVAMGQPKDGESLQEYALRQAEMRGMILFAETLLNIEPAKRVDSNNNGQ